MLQHEFDFRVEAQRVDEFALAFADAGFEHLVQLPRVVHALTTEKVRTHDAQVSCKRTSDRDEWACCG